MHLKHLDRYVQYRSQMLQLHLIPPGTSSLRQHFRPAAQTMTSAEQQIANAAAGARSSVAAIQAGHYEMADQTAREANEADEIRIGDGKPA